jgi:hypothetical protein
MDKLSVKESNSWVVYDIIADYWVIYVPLFLAGILSYKYLNQRRSKLPPVCIVPFAELLKSFMEGKIHNIFLKVSRDIGLVYRVPIPFQMACHFIVCDATLARLVGEGDTSKQILAGEKRIEGQHAINQITMNRSTIATKKTHGEGWGEF